MTADPIFNAIATAETVWAEVSRLVTSLPDGFAPELGLGLPHEVGLEEDWASARTGYYFKVTKAVPRQRLPSQLLFVLDLARPNMPSSWPHARQSLLTCAYAPKYDEGWDVSDVVVGMDGRPVARESRDNLTHHAGGRLLEWQGSDLPWRHRGWFFSVPLLEIDGRDALRREIIDPIKGLLLSERSAEEVIDKGAAIRFVA